MGSIGSVSVDVVPDASGFAQKLKAKLSGLQVKVGVDLDDKGVRTKLAALSKDKTVKIDVDLDDAKIKAKLAALRKQQKLTVDADLQSRGFTEKIRGLLRPRTVIINADVKDQIAKARLDEIAGRTRNAQVKADLNSKLAEARLEKLTRPRTANIRANLSGNASSRMQTLVGLAASLGPAIIPATAALGALSGALAAPIVGAGGAVGIFGAVAVGAIAKAKKDTKDIADLLKKAASASKPADAKKYTQLANELRDSLPKAEKQFIKSKDTIKQSFADLLKSTDKPVFGALAAGAGLFAKVLPKLAPVVTSVGGALTGMIGGLSKWSDSKSFKGLIDYLAGPGTKAFSSFVGIAGNVAKGLGGMVRAFTPLGTSVLGGLTKFTDKFSKFGQGLSKNKGFQDFVAYVKRVGPKVGETLGNIAKAVGNIVKALAPQGSTALGLINGLAKAVAKMKPGQIAQVAGAVGALGLATGKFGKLTSLSLLVSALSYAYKHSDAFKKLADGAGKLAGALNELPDPAKYAGLAGLLALYTGAKGGKALGGLGKPGGLLSKVTGGGVQKVFVTNPGFDKDKSSKDGLGKDAAAAVKFAPAVAAIAASAGPWGIAAAAGITAAIAGEKWNLGGKPNSAITGGKFGEMGRDAFKNIDLGPALDKVREMDGLFKNMSIGNLGAFNDFFGNLKDAASGLTDAFTNSTGFDKLKQSIGGLGLDKLVSKGINFDAKVNGLELVQKLADAAKDLKGKAVKIAASVAGLNPVEALKGAIGKVAGKAVKVAASVAGTGPARALTGAIRAVGGKAVKVAASVAGTGAARALTGAIKAVIGKAVKVAGNVSGTGAVRALSGAIGAVHEKAVKIAASVSGSGAVSALAGAISAVHSKAVSITTTVSKIFKHAAGGTIRGAGTSTSDSIPVLLSDGEEVIRTRQARKHRGLLKAINAGAVGFAQGGTVGTIGTVTRFAGGGTAGKGPTTGQVVRNNDREFNLAATLGVKDLREEFAELRKSFLLGGKAFANLQRQAIRAAFAYSKQSHILEKAKETLATLKEDKKSYGEGVAAALTSDSFGLAHKSDEKVTDINGKEVDKDPRSAAEIFKATLDADTARATKALADEKTLESKGISAELEKSLMASGNTELLAQLATMTSAQIDTYDASYAAQTASAGAVGDLSSGSAYDAQIKTQTDLIATTKATMEKLQAQIEKIEAAVERGAEKGFAERKKEAAQRRRAHR